MRPYRRSLTQLSRPLQVTVVLGVLAGLTVAVGVTFQVEVAASVFFALFLGVIASAGFELSRYEKGWIRALGILLIAAAAITAVLTILTLWYLHLLCGDGCN